MNEPVRIGLTLPGVERKTTVPVAETYIITIERGDGIACTEIEAQTVMSMYIMSAKFGQKPKRTRKKKAEVVE